MVDCGFQFVHSRCSSCAGHFILLIFGLILLYCATLASCVKARVNCSSIASTYQHCRFHPAGVHDLDCFLERSNYNKVACEWKPGDHSSKQTHTLIIRQTKDVCLKYENLTEAFQSVTLFSKSVTVEVLENSKSTNCTRAFFSGSRQCLKRCGPPNTVSFGRHSGKLDVNVTWAHNAKVGFYFVRYKSLGSSSWNESPVRSRDEKGCSVGNLTSSLTYYVQIQCVINDSCSNYPWSQTYTVPSELTTKPEIVRSEVNGIAEKRGVRLLLLSWMFPPEEPHAGYRVTVGKASGESQQQINTTAPEIRLILSYSDYHVSVSAFNNASVSPGASETIPQHLDMSAFGYGRLNVTVQTNRSFTVHWKDDRIRSYVCYSAEWRKAGQKAVHMSFYENKRNHRSLSPLPEPLEPYTRYTLTLHRRPNKDTCNMKRINDSESTYGSTHFYFQEGAPVSAPANVSSHNVTVDSVALEWSPIPEEDIRGFLLGHTIHYTEYPGGTQRNITVDPTSHSYNMDDLKSGTVYQVQISGFTKAGAGVRSPPSLFQTNSQEDIHIKLTSIIPAFAALITVLICGPSIIKRTKIIVWPSIPNPGNSNTMQKIERTCELELLESINTLKVEEWDTSSLQVVEKDAEMVDTFPCLHNSEDEGDSPQMTCNWLRRDAVDAGGDDQRDDPTETLSNLPSSRLAFPSEYTTMEMFNHMMPRGNPTSTDAKEGEAESGKLGLDYIGQFSTSPLSESEMSTIL